MRKHGDVGPIREKPVTRDEAMSMLSEVCGARNWKIFEERGGSRFCLRDGPTLTFPLQLPEADERLRRRLSSNPDKDRVARRAGHPRGGERVW